MTPNRVLLHLTKTIQDIWAQVDAYIRGKELHELSLNVSSLPPLQLSSEADAARNAALKALDEFQTHLLGLVGEVMSQIGDVCGTLISVAAGGRCNTIRNYAELLTS